MTSGPDPRPGATVCASISIRRKAAASGPPASTSGPPPRQTTSIRPTRCSSSDADTRKLAPTASARGCPLPTCRPSTTRSGLAARASRRAAGRSSGTSAITSSAPAPRRRATSRLAAATGSSASPPTRDASAGSATPKIPTRIPPIVSSRDGATAAVLDRLTARPLGDDFAAAGRHVGLGDAGRERRPQRFQRAGQELGAQHVGRLLLGVAALRERHAPAVERPAWGPPSRPPGPARRIAPRRPAGRWYTRRAPASRESRPYRRW